MGWWNPWGEAREQRERAERAQKENEHLTAKLQHVREQRDHAQEMCTDRDAMVFRLTLEVKRLSNKLKGAVARDPETGRYVKRSDQ